MPPETKGLLVPRTTRVVQLVSSSAHKKVSREQNQPAAAESTTTRCHHIADPPEPESTQRHADVAPLKHVCIDWRQKKRRNAGGKNTRKRASVLGNVDTLLNYR